MLSVLVIKSHLPKLGLLDSFSVREVVNQMKKLSEIGSALITELERERGSKILVYFTGDRPPLGTRIAEDVIRPMYDHLANLGFQDGQRRRKIDLFLYSRGGDVSVPWRIAGMIREFCTEFNVIVPYRAQSAATLLSLGADSIIMGRKAELGPIDPTLSKNTGGGAEGVFTQQEIAVEDVNSYISFIREKVNINDQSALAALAQSLIQQVGPLAIGTVNRQNSHIRLVARKLLTSRSKKADEERINSIIETLTEKMYSHGHGIGRREASDIGLPVIEPGAQVEKLIWDLYRVYEGFLSMLDPLEPESILGAAENATLPDIPTAVLESTNKLHVCVTQLDILRTRKVPPSPQINLNLSVQIPPGVNPQQPDIQAILQKVMQQITPLLPGLVQQEIVRQSPVTGIALGTVGGKWQEWK